MQACSTSVGGALLECLSLKRLLSSPVAFCHSERDLVGIVHGDDFVFVGVDRDLDFVLRVLKENFELKDRGRLGSGDHDNREVDMLGRKIRWHKWGLTWEGDERHRKMVIDFFGMGENSKRLMKNGYKEDEVKDVKESHELGAEECKSYRMLSARLNFMTQDNPAYNTLQRRSAATSLALKVPTLRGSRSSQDSSWVLKRRGGNIRGRKSRKRPT